MHATPIQADHHARIGSADGEWTIGEHECPVSPVHRHTRIFTNRLTHPHMNGDTPTSLVLTLTTILSRHTASDDDHTGTLARPTIQGVTGLRLVTPTHEILRSLMTGTEPRNPTTIGLLTFQSGEPTRVLDTFARGEDRRGNARQPKTIQSRLTILDGGLHTRATQRHTHPNTLTGFNILHKPTLETMRPMLVVPASPPVAQPVHDTFRITSPHTIPVRVQAEEHTAPRMPDFQNSYFLTHAYNDTILLSNQQYEKACRPGIEIPGLHAKNPSKRYQK